MPFTDPIEFESAPDRFQGLGSAQDNQAAALSLMPSSHGNAALNLGGMAALAVPDLVDTVASSKLLSWATGVQRGDVNRAVLHAIDMPGLTDFYNQHQKGIEIGSGIGGLIASELVARKLTAPAGAVMGALRSLPYARRLATLDAEYTNAMATVRAVDTALASRGAVGLEQYAGEAAVKGLQWDSKAGNFTEGLFTIARDKAVFNAKALGFARGARNALATEAVAAAALNQNEFLYTDSAAQNLAWMGLGVGIGGALDWFHSAYQIRKAVNGDEIRRAFASSLDPEGVEESRLLWHGKAVKPISEAEGFLGGTYTDVVTNMLSSATNLKEFPVGGADARALLDNRTRLATQHRLLADETMQKVTTKGITTDGSTRFSMNAPGYGNHARMAMYRDPGAFYGVEMVGGIPENKTSWGVHESHMKRLEERIAEVEERLALKDLPAEEAAGLRTLRQRLAYEQTLTPQVMIDGEKMPISEARAIEGFVEPQVKFSAAQRVKIPGIKMDPHGLWEASTPGMPAPVSIDSDFLIHIPSGKSLKEADHFDVLRLYRAADKAIEQMSRFTGPIKLPENPNWFQLDMAEEILRRSDNAVSIVWPTGMTRDSAQVESFAQKAEELQYWLSKTQAESIKRGKKGLDPESYLSRLRVRFNLPRLTAYERGVTGEVEHPVESLLRGAQDFGLDKLRQMESADLKEAVAARKRVGDIAPVTAADIESLSGNSFRYMLDEKGEPVKPLLMYSRALKPFEWTQDTIAERLAARKMRTVQTMVAPEAGELTKRLAAGIMESPDAQKAMMTHELMDNQIQGSLAGAAPQTFLGSASKAISTSEWVARDNPTLLAATRVRDAVSRQARDFMHAQITGVFGDSLNQLANPRNASTKLLLDQFHSFRGGWDLGKKPVARQDGFFAFKLLDTEKNRARWLEEYGTNLPEGQTLLSPEGKEVVLDARGLDLQQRFNTVSEALRKEKNTLLRSLGMRQIDSTAWYVPPPNTNGKFIGFVIGPDGKPVPGMGVVASTPEEFARAKAALTPALDAKGMGYVFRTQDEIRNFASIWDRAQMDMINPSTTAVQPGKKSRGVLAGRQINLSAFEDSMSSMRDQFLRHADDVTEALFKEQINAAKARSAMAATETKNRAKLGAETRYRSIYDIYQENLLGKSKLNSKGSVLAPLYNAVEGGVDAFLSHVTPTASNVTTAVSAWLDKRVPWSKSAAAQKDFDSLSKALGKYMPFESTTELIERQGAGARPWTAAGIGNNLNQFAAGMLLRVAEVAHPIMNLAGIVNAMPAVVRNFTPRPNETAEEFATRIGHVATIFSLPGGKSFGVPDMAKLGSQSLMRAIKQTSHADFDYMVSRGYLSQEVAEFHRQFGSIESKNSWQKFFLGDSNSKGFASKGVVGWLSILSDKSEDFSRAWGHMAGLELADSLGITGREAKHAFAHDIANKMIANYSPTNRPEIFQGALGSALGLFQSFVQNYYQRMFRYIETKDYSSLMTQFGTQGAIFGVGSLPGWKEFSGLMTTASDGESDPTSQMRNRLGPGAGDLVLNGLLSHLPNLFGAPAVDLYSRGDTSIRVPGTVQVPAAAILSKLYTGITEAMQAFSDANPALTGTQLAEIASNMIANRPIAGMIEQFVAGGNDTDHYGQLVSDTRGAMETAYRLMGLRSERQSNEINAFYANKTEMEHKAAADEVLRLATRAALRGGNTDALPGIFQKYVENGGDPRYFRRWLKESFEAATTTRGERQLEEALKDPSKMNQVVRLLDAGVSIDADEKTPDPASVYGQADQGDELDQVDHAPGLFSNQLTTVQDASGGAPGY